MIFTTSSSHMLSDAFKASLNTDGFMEDMRASLMGTCIDGTDDADEDGPTGPGIVMSTDNDKVYLFCGATITSAMYELLEEQPGHTLLQEVVDEGVEVIMWDSNIPKDMIHWLKKEGNKHQDHGWSFSPLEMLEEVPKAAAAWIAFMFANTIEPAALPQSGASSLYNQHKRWFEQHYTKEFGNFTCYNNTKHFLGLMSESGDTTREVFDAFMSDMRSHLDMFPGMKTGNVVAAAHEVAVLMTSHFADMEAYIYKLIFSELLKLCFPRAGASADRQWALGKALRREALKYLRAPMGGSVVYDPKRAAVACKAKGAAKAKAARETKEAKPTTRKAKKKAAAKKPANRKRKTNNGSASASSVTVPGSAPRESAPVKKPKGPKGGVLPQLVMPGEAMNLNLAGREAKPKLFLHDVASALMSLVDALGGTDHIHQERAATIGGDKPNPIHVAIVRQVFNFSTNRKLI